MAFQVTVNFGTLPVLEKGFYTEYDTPILRIELYHLQGNIISLTEGISRAVDIRMIQLGNRYEALHVVRQFHHDTAIEQANDFTAGLRVIRVNFGQRQPRILFHLLDTE